MIWLRSISWFFVVTYTNNRHVQIYNICSWSLVFSLMSPTCLSWVVRGHRMVTHWGEARVHGSARWGPSVVRRGRSMVGRRSTVVWWWSSRVHAWWRGPRVRSRSWGLSLSLSLCGCSSLLLHLLPCLHLSIFELLHVERLTLSEQLLPLKLQLQR